ncbi:hypothetical protein [Ferrimonas sp.]|uniref:hypothetical protein n=1 Tax=Ferrimonas sp. TaxID=2080861 RepID=UPI003A94DF9C
MWSRKEAEAIRRALQGWQQQGELTPEQVQRLAQGLEERRFDWLKLARYSFYVAVASLVLAVASVLVDQRVIDWIAAMFNAPVLARALALTLLGIGLLAVGLWRRGDGARPYQVEALFLGSVLAFSGALAYLGDYLQPDNDSWRWYLLAATGLYLLMGLLLRSLLIWGIALLSLMLWLCVHSAEVAGWEGLWFGMNLPLRLALLGGLIALAGQGMAKRLPQLAPLTRHFGWLSGLGFLWLVSIFGNHGNWDHWAEVPQWQLWPWALGAMLVCLAAIWAGIRWSLPPLRLYGLLFLILHLYSRYFEQLWDSLHKGVLFAIAGLGFWLLGTQAERIWSRQRDNNGKL